MLALTAYSFIGASSLKNSKIIGPVQQILPIEQLWTAYASEK